MGRGDLTGDPGIGKQEISVPVGRPTSSVVCNAVEIGSRQGSGVDCWVVEVVEAIKRRFELLAPGLNERTRRLAAAAEAVASAGAVASRWPGRPDVRGERIRQGIRELEASRRHCHRPSPAARAAGGNRPSRWIRACALRWRRWSSQPARGDPESPLRWTCKSLRRLAEELRQQGPTGQPSVGEELLRALDYSLKQMRKVLEGSQHPGPERTVRVPEPPSAGATRSQQAATP